MQDYYATAPADLTHIHLIEIGHPLCPVLLAFHKVVKTSFSLGHWSQDVIMEAFVWMHVSSSFLFLLDPNILNERLSDFILFTVQRFYDR